jgi:diaminopimelate decarboxylase
VRFIIVDSINELIDLLHLSEVLGKESEILLRVNPNYTPRGLNRSSATGSRVGSAFGLDFMGGEVTAALDMLTKSSKIRFAGFHFHIGTGIRNPKDHANALRCIADLFRIARMRGLMVRVLNVGGGFASMTSRELTNSEMLLYQAFGIFPSGLKNGEHVSFADFARAISSEVLCHFPLQEIPELMFEPGRCITSPNQFLLLTVERVKERTGVAKWVIVDGGLSTVTLPTYYEYHEVLLCNNLHRPCSEKVNIIGPACFSGDIVYRNKWMPRVEPGEVIAIMDTGAYFTALESSFGFARPAIITVRESECRIVRSRESFEESIARDQLHQIVHQEENIP